MRLVYQSPIKRKLQRVIMLTSVTSLLIACAGFVAYDLIAVRRAMRSDLSTLADVIAANAQASLIFDDVKAAENTLASLRARPNIISAAIYRQQGKLFANYVRPGEEVKFPTRPEAPAHHFEEGQLVLFYPILFNDQSIGTLYLQSDLERMYHRFQSYLGIALLVLAGSALAAFAFSTRLQKGISQPILELAETAKIVSEKKDFSLRAKKYSDDEIGLLAESFNEMLAHIQERDAALQQSNDALSRLNRDLEERVRLRTAALNESNEQMQIFTYSVAHDLRAPLRAISGFSQALAEDYGPHLDETGQDLLKRMKKSTAHMDRLIQDLLSYSRISREQLTFEPISLKQVVENVLNSHASDIQAAKAEVAVESTLPPVIGHPATLENIITNLLPNALKYVPPGVPPRIHIRAEDLGKTIRLWIQDNGIGIAREFHEKVFGIFSRLHGSESYPGTGIGLALVRKGTERMGGRTGVESEPDKGSKFWIELPKAT